MGINQNLSQLRQTIKQMKSASSNWSPSDVADTLEPIALKSAINEVALFRACQLASNEDDQKAAQLFEHLVKEATVSVRKLYYDSI